jgi:hypothetical protein
MKKEYISPKTLVVTLRATQLLTESLPYGDKTTGASGSLSRRQSNPFQNEEDEDEDDF